ncbi:MAG: hypothetical protein N3D80_06365 [Ignavibacterium album]|jgi:hypothetical protein|uniref:hypothetical protein n=1 Tax=Ignavibacterium album TaxID=591197 RepID=UPI0026EB7A42|nr:hypothetical protein [Ignavibacterium album]MCX8105480.1 hypothetical protein [Ignavibacterium album]
MFIKILYSIALLYLFIYNVLENETNSFYNRRDIKAQIDFVIYKNSGKINIAKSHERISTRDRFQIIIRSYTDTKLLLVNYSASECKILQSCFINSGKDYYFPAKDEFYFFDGKNNREVIFILLFKDLLKELDLLTNPAVDCNIKYKRLNLYYSENLTINSKPVPPIIHLSGNIRETELSEEIFGDNLILKKYSFDVQSE